jgi:hypothetical protein
VWWWSDGASHEPTGGCWGGALRNSEIQFRLQLWWHRLQLWWHRLQLWWLILYNCWLIKLILYKTTTAT